MARQRWARRPLHVSHADEGFALDGADARVGLARTHSTPARAVAVGDDRVRGRGLALLGAEADPPTRLGVFGLRLPGTHYERERGRHDGDRRRDDAQPELHVSHLVFPQAAGPLRRRFDGRGRGPAHDSPERGSVDRLMILEEGL